MGSGSGSLADRLVRSRSHAAVPAWALASIEGVCGVQAVERVILSVLLAQQSCSHSFDLRVKGEGLVKIKPRSHVL